VGRAVPALALLVFPVHMAVHLLDVILGGASVGVPAPPSAVVHWAMLLGVAAASILFRTELDPRVEGTPTPPMVGRLPAVAAGILLAVVAGGIGPLGGRWELYAAAGPLMVFALLAWRRLPLWSVAVAAAAMAPLAGGRGLAALVCLGLALVAARGGAVLRRPRLAVAVGAAVVTVLVVSHTWAVRLGERAYLELRLAGGPPGSGAGLADRVLALHPSPVALHMSTAQALRARGRLSAAEQEYRYACAREPGLVWARAQLGSVLTSLGRTDEAIAELRSALAVAAGVHQLHHNLGVAFLVAGRLDEARAALERASELAGDDGGTLSVVALARVDMAAGRPELAVERLEGALAEHPDRDELRRELASVLQARGDLAAAEVQLRSLLERGPPDAPLLCRLALLVAEDPARGEEAAALATRAVAAAETARSLETLGLVLLRQGRAREAAAVLLRAHARCGQPQECRRLEARLEALGEPRWRGTRD
jgi:Tfp pilus assembly protein PilF